MLVLRIELKAPVCSFRYPHFLIGRQLSFDMPPPATIYGHIASALGDYPDPQSFRFAYAFTAKGKADDLESQHIITPGGRPFAIGGTAFPSSTNATAQPVRRQFLFDCYLILYLDAPQLRDHFVEPKFTVVLGRSQDLASYVRVSEIELEIADRGYYENTILPGEMRRRIGRGTTVLMPRYVAPPPMRQASFDKYVVLKERIFDGPGADLGSRQAIRIDGESIKLFVDPETPEWHGGHRALVFHSFV
jgi:CRISPR-associated protein Cas5t